MQNFWHSQSISKKNIDIIQINLGDLCCLECSHCHIEASPRGTRNMDEKTAKKIIEALKKSDVKNIEFTGGEPILNPNLPLFISELSQDKNLMVRTNLVALDFPQYEKLITFFKEHKVTLTGSLPSVFNETTDSQRGERVFERSIKVLQKLNQAGYGKNIPLNLAYNPDGAYLPRDNKELESKYRRVLSGDYKIDFDAFYSIVNVPIKRFKKALEEEGTLDGYNKQLKDNFNPANIDKIMCRSTLLVDYRGSLYDCDFNHASEKKITGHEEQKLWNIDLENFNPPITFDSYCYACTVNSGSSCHGTLDKNQSCCGNDTGTKDENCCGTGDITDSVKEYYGEIIQKTSDLKTSACCTSSMPDHVKESLTYIHDEIIMKYYGCGSPIPLALEGLRALDMGCGTGRDVYILSRGVGKEGFAYGIDMTENQLNVAKKHLKEQMSIFGYEKENVTFILDYMENLENHIEQDSLDLVTSNCVINLAQDKEIILKHIYNVLKNGGELYFADVYADRRIPAEIASDPVLYGECLGGALYYKDFERLAKKTGFSDPRVVESREIIVNNPEAARMVENIRFYSITYRLWKIDGLEDDYEDYGHIGLYKGGIPFSPFTFKLDKNHIFEKNKPERICGNTALMLKDTRFSKYFDVIGDFSQHFGTFENCGTAEERDKGEPEKCC